MFCYDVGSYFRIVKKTDFSFEMVFTQEWVVSAAQGAEIFTV